MALNKEKVQDLIDDFVVSNVFQINEVATESPMLYDAVINALNLLSRKFGTIQAINIPKPAAPSDSEKPKANALHPSVQMLEDFVDINGNETRVGRIDYENEEVTFFTADPTKPIKLKFSVVNDAIEKGGIKLKAQTPKLNPLIKVDEKFIDKNNFDSILVVKEIIRLDEKVRFLRWRNKTNITLDFSVVNDLLLRGDFVPYTQANELNPKIVLNSWFKDTSKTPPDNTFFVEEIDSKGKVVVTNWGTYKRDFTFVLANDMIEYGHWVEPDELNPLVDIDEIFEDKASGNLISITDIDYAMRKVNFDIEGLGQRVLSFDEINYFIEEKKWVHKQSSKVTQSNKFGALTLNPSVHVGQKYIDLDDDSNFSVLLIDQKKQVVTINWNEDDIQAEVDFEDFNDNLQAATWVLAPDQAQGPATEAEILEAIEGLELIGDAESKKEIAELKKQLKQLKKKKP